MLDKEYRDKNKEIIRERRKALYSEEKKIANRIRNKRYREKNREKIRKMHSDWEANNIDHIREYRFIRRNITNLRQRMRYIPKKRKIGKTKEERVKDGIYNLKVS